MRSSQFRKKLPAPIFIGMDAQHDTDNLAETLLKEIRKTTPNAFLGFPPPEELERLRNERRAAHILQLEQEEGRERVRFLKLKQAALANIRRNRP
jgi:hypothetical protein